MASVTVVTCVTFANIHIVPLQARRVQVAHVGVVPARRLGDAAVAVTVEPVPTDALIRVVDRRTHSIPVAIVGNITRAALGHALRNSIARVSVVTVAVVQVQIGVVETRRVLGTPRSIAELYVGDACVVLVFHVSFDALADLLVALCVTTTFGVVFTVGVVLATEVWSARVTVAVVPEVTHADELVCAGVDAVRVKAACAVWSGFFNAFERITFVALWADAVLSFPVARSVTGQVGADGVWWTVGVLLAFN